MGFSEGLGIVHSAGGTLHQIIIVMSSWGCQYRSVSAGNCSSAPGAKSPQLITVNVSLVNDATSPPTPGVLLGSITYTFNIPSQPTSTPSQCGGNNTTWYSFHDNACYNRLATSIEMNFANQHIVIPPNNKIIVTVVCNTSDFSPRPLGQTVACNAPSYSNSAGCRYDSLNVSADTTDGTFNFVGSHKYQRRICAPRGFPLRVQTLFGNHGHRSPGCRHGLLGRLSPAN